MQAKKKESTTYKSLQSSNQSGEAKLSEHQLKCKISSRHGDQRFLPPELYKCLSIDA